MSKDRNIKQGLAPVHVGRIIKELYMKPIGVNTSQLANCINCSNSKVSRILNGTTRLSVEMAIKLGAAFGQNPEVFLKLQLNYDLWYADKDKLTKGIDKLV